MITKYVTLFFIVLFFFLSRITLIFSDFFWDALKYIFAEILSLRDWVVVLFLAKARSEEGRVG